MLRCSLRCDLDLVGVRRSCPASPPASVLPPSDDAEHAAGRCASRSAAVGAAAAAIGAHLPLPCSLVAPHPRVARAGRGPLAHAVLQAAGRAPEQGRGYPQPHVLRRRGREAGSAERGARSGRRAGRAAAALRGAGRRPLAGRRPRSVERRPGRAAGQHEALPHPGRRADGAREPEHAPAPDEQPLEPGAGGHAASGAACATSRAAAAPSRA